MRVVNLARLNILYDRVSQDALDHAMTRETVKLCPQCTRWLPLAAYATSTRRRLGVNSQCKTCVEKYNRAYRAALAQAAKGKG